MQEKANLERERMEQELRERNEEDSHEVLTSKVPAHSTHQAKGDGEPADQEPWVLDRKNILKLVLLSLSRVRALARSPFLSAYIHTPRQPQ